MARLGISREGRGLSRWVKGGCRYLGKESIDCVGVCIRSNEVDVCVCVCVYECVCTVVQ